MKQAAEYRQHAEACRKLAGTARTEDERKNLLDIAATWERLALARERIARGEDSN